MFDILICTLIDGFSLAECKFSNSVAKTLVIVPRAPPQTLTRLEESLTINRPFLVYKTQQLEEKPCWCAIAVKTIAQKHLHFASPQ